MKLAEEQSQAMASPTSSTTTSRRWPSASMRPGYPATGGGECRPAITPWPKRFRAGATRPARANMLKSGVTKMGIAAIYAPNTKYKVFWTLILASPDGQ